jgi:3-oxoacyl-[acyl-carrier-protein] synthase III
MARFANIVSTGRYLPEREVTNDELRARFDPIAPEFVNKMEASTGITRRWWAPDDWATSDVALPAARQALERAGRTPEEVDLIILGTDSPDYITPATSVVVQHKLGAGNAGTFDVGCACASFPTALAIGAGMVATNPGLNVVLVIGAYMMHKLTDPNDPMIFLYGDGAGAAVLEPRETPGFVSSVTQAGGEYHRHSGIYSGGTFEPATVDSVKAGRTTTKILVRYPPELNHELWPRMARRVAEEGGFTVEDVDLIIFTQVRKPSIELVMDTLGLPMEKTHTIMERFGYTGSACIPMALDDAREQGRLHTGDLAVLIASGVGYNLAGVAFRML